MCTIPAPRLHKAAAALQDLPYVDRTRFKEEQQNAPPKGFCSSDFMRRGEFTSTIRTEQYRTMLKACLLADLDRPCRALSAQTCVLALQPHFTLQWQLQHTG